MNNIELAQRPDGKNELFHVGTQYETGWVAFRSNARMEDRLLVLNQDKGSRVFRGGKGLEIEHSLAGSLAFGW